MYRVTSVFTKTFKHYNLWALPLFVLHVLNKYLCYVHCFLSVQVQKGLEKAKMEEARLRQDLNKAKEREKEEKKRVREDSFFSHLNFYT